MYMHIAIIAEILYHANQVALQSQGYGFCPWEDLAEHERALWIDTVKHARANGLNI